VIVPTDAAEVVEFLTAISIAYVVFLYAFVHYLCRHVARGLREPARPPVLQTAG
jgi:hypothetical protein